MDPIQGRESSSANSEPKTSKELIEKVFLFLQLHDIKYQSEKLKRILELLFEVNSFRNSITVGTEIAKFPIAFELIIADRVIRHYFDVLNPDIENVWITNSYRSSTPFFLRNEAFFVLKSEFDNNDIVQSLFVPDLPYAFYNNQNDQSLSVLIEHFQNMEPELYNILRLNHEKALARGEKRIQQIQAHNERERAKQREINSKISSIVDLINSSKDLLVLLAATSTFNRTTLAKQSILKLSTQIENKFSENVADPGIYEDTFEKVDVLVDSLTEHIRFPKLIQQIIAITDNDNTGIRKTNYETIELQSIIFRQFMYDLERLVGVRSYERDDTSALQGQLLEIRSVDNQRTFAAHVVDKLKHELKVVRWEKRRSQRFQNEHFDPPSTIRQFTQFTMSFFDSCVFEDTLLASRISTQREKEIFEQFKYEHRHLIITYNRHIPRFSPQRTNRYFELEIKRGQYNVVAITMLSKTEGYYSFDHEDEKSIPLNSRMDFADVLTKLQDYFDLPDNRMIFDFEIQ